ncbi:MAG: menaquinone biosynthesis protein [Desulfobacterales bacterium]
MQIGYINYLNCYPFYYHMFEKEPLQEINVIPGFPSELNRMMKEKILDLSPVSSATYADIKEDVLLLPEFCLSSVGYVGSVILCSNYPIEELNNKNVGLSGASHTSRVLLKILLEKFYGIEPCYLKAGPFPDLTGHDAALIIGNDAMRGCAEKALYKYDLGELWLKKTGFPVVFAVFAVRKNVIRENMRLIKAVMNSYRASLQCLVKEKENVIIRAEQMYPDISYDINGYYDTLQFEFTDNLKIALKYYLSAAEELNLLNKVESLNFFEEA